MYKKSFYNMIVEELEDGKILMFNTLNSSMGVMDLECKELYQNIEKINNVNELGSSENKNLNILLENGFIVEHDFDEFKYYKLIRENSRFSSESLSLTIATTLDCNMACPYCYEDRKPIYMDTNIADKILSFTKNKIEQLNTKGLYITWYGGEPLLNFEIIEYLSKNFIEICTDKNIIYDAGIITNGVLLTKDIAQKLNKYKVSNCQITIDGPKEINDSRRLLLDGASSFDIISKNLDEISNLINVNIRCNIDKFNIHSINYLNDFFTNKKVEIHFAPIDKGTDACSVDLGNCLTEEEFREIEMNKINIEYKNNKDIANFLTPPLKPLGCSSLGNNSYVINPDGMLLKCWNYVGDKSKSIGDVSKGDILNTENVKWLTLDVDKKCIKCKLLPICSSGCPDIIIREGMARCSHRQLNLKEKIKLVYKKFIYEKENACINA